MRTIFRASTFTFGAGVVGALLASSAFAGCGDVSSLQGPFEFAQAITQPKTLARSSASAGEAVTPDSRSSGGSTASMVGLWRFQFISQGNTGHNPSIPDGALLDFGFHQWHSDGTEIVYSAGHPLNTGSSCIGVWAQTGFLTFEMTHFPIAFDPTSGAVTAYVQVNEKDTLSPSGDSYTGTFTQDVYDPKGNHVDHVVGTVVAVRMTVDATLPSAIPSNPIQPQ